MVCAASFGLRGLRFWRKRVDARDFAHFVQGFQILVSVCSGLRLLTWPLFIFTHGLCF